MVTCFMRLQYGNIHEKQWKLNKRGTQEDRGQKYLGFSLCPVGIPVDQLQQPQLAIAWNTSYKINFDPSCRSSGQKFEELTDDYWSVIHIKPKEVLDGYRVKQQNNGRGQIDSQWPDMRYWSKTKQQFIDMIYKDECLTSHCIGCAQKKLCTCKNTNMKHIYRYDDESLTRVLLTRHCLGWAQP